MAMNNYSQEIAAVIENHLRRHDWKYQFRQEEGLFVFGLNVPGKAKTLMYHVLVTDNGFTVVTRYPMGPDITNQTEMDNMTRFLTRANYGLRVGNFEMDLDDGEIRYKIHNSLRGTTASDELVFESIHCASAMFSRFEDGLMGILFGGLNDKEAMAKCENGSAGMRVLLERLEKELQRRAAAGNAEQKPDEAENKRRVVISELLRRAAERAAREKAAREENYEQVDEN